MLLLLIRHGKAFERDPERWPDDDLRPLTKRGHAEIAALARALPDMGLTIDRLYSSPLTRAIETAQDLAEHGRKVPEPIEVEALGHGFSVEAILALLSISDAEETIAMVGHEPDCSTLLAALIGGQSRGIEFKKGAVAGIRFEGTPEMGEGVLEFLLPPKRLWASEAG